MKRLTGRRDGRTYIVGCPNFALPKIVGLIIQQTVDRLAAIEDILGDDYDLDRLRELVEADRVGHCVVFDLHYPVVSEYYKDEDGRYIREVSGVVSETKYKAALKEREQE